MYNTHTMKQSQNSHGVLVRSALATAIGAVLGSGAGGAAAALPTGAVLNFVTGGQIVASCLLGTTPPCTDTRFNITDIGGSYFSMDQGGNPGADPSEKTPLSMFAPIIVDGVTTQQSAGQHTGAPDGSETPAIDEPWNFFGNTGLHTLLTPVSVISDLGSSQTLDFSGWGVNWGNFGPGGGDGPTIPMGGTATLVCTPASCPDNATYTLDMAVHVPQAFTSVPYTLHLEGTVSLPGATPVSVDDAATTIAANAVTINVLGNDKSADGLDPTTVTVTSGPSNGNTTVNADGTITYTPNTGPDFTGTDSFTYTVASNLGKVSAPATVTVTVQANAAPVAVNDTVNTSTAILNNTSLNIDILANDTDSNNAPGLPGGIDPATVTIVSPPTNGNATINADGSITYSQATPVGGADVFTYQVSDIDPVKGGLTSNIATVTVNVTATTSDWPSAPDPTKIPVLYFTPGVQGDPIDLSVPAQSGSYFTMQVTQDTLIYTVLKPGPDGGIVVGHEQPAGNTHTGQPSGNEEISVDQPWSFFFNTGLHFTKNGGIQGNPDGTLNFDRRWIVSWNGIPEIDLGGDNSGRFPEDLHFATIACTPSPCADQSTYTLTYAAHVPPGDPSGFGGVPYTLHLEGTVRFLDATPQASNGTMSSFTRLNASAVADDAGVTLQCSGGCFDYTITGVTNPQVSIVLPLAGGVPNNPVWRILDNGTWRSFDTSGGDSVLSAPFVSGTATCPAPGDASYGPLTSGDYCVQLTITDNGPNDLDPATGTISDPSGLGSGGSAGGGTTFVDTRTSSTSGCSIAGTGSNPLERGDWGLLAAFLAWLGWGSARRRKN